MKKTKSPKQEFQELQDKWYGKLEKSGFQDIESDENHLKFYSSQFAAQFRDGAWQAKAAYYQMASNFLEEYKFDTKRDRIIWEYHSNALSYRDIAKILNKLKTTRTASRTSVYNVLKRLRIKMFDMYMALDSETEYHE